MSIHRTSNKSSTAATGGLPGIQTGRPSVAGNLPQFMGGSGGAGGHNEKVTEAKVKACYAALSAEGPFALMLKIEGKDIGLDTELWPCGEDEA